MPDTIYTLNAKDNVLFHIIKSTFKMSDMAMCDTIEAMHKEMIDRLNKKGISYDSLKGALVPNQDKDRFETCFVFDSLKIDRNNYGYKIFSKMIPLMDKDSTYSILCGDYIDIMKTHDSPHILYKLLDDAMIKVNVSNYIASCQYYLVYFNRLTTNQRQHIIDGLSDEAYFVGYADVTHQSLFKSYLSNILVHSYIKQRHNIIGAHLDDCLDSENINMIGYPFEENEFDFVSIRDESFSVFLSYKIQSTITDDYDVSTSLNALSPKFRKIRRLKFLLESPKWNDYLFKEGNSKKEILQTLGYSISDKKEFKRRVRKEIASNYIYNLTIDKEHNTLKFNICPELKTIHNTYRKTTIALEYIPSRRTLRFITIT